jgi:hypothetical protein
MPKYVVTGKKPFYGADCRNYPPGSVVDLVEFQEITDEDGNKKTIGMKPGRFLKPYEPKAKAPAKAEAADKSAKGRLVEPKAPAPAAATE